MKKPIGNAQVAKTEPPAPEENRFDEERKGVVKIITQIPKLKPGHKATEESEQPPVPVPDVSSGADSGPVDVAKLPIDLSAVNPSSVAMAEKFGIPIRQILSWMQSVEARFKELENFAPTLRKIDQALTEAGNRQALQQQAQPEPPQQIPQPYNPASIANLIPLFAEMLKGAQTPVDDVYMNLAKSSLQADIDLSKTLKNSIMSQILSKASKNITEAVLPE